MGSPRHIVFDCDGTLLNSKDNGKPFKGMGELLHRLKEAECTLYIWTGRDRASLEKWLTETNLRRYFTEIRCSHEAQPKPHPEGLKEMLKDVDATHCAVVGDTWADMKGAKMFGAHAVGALWDGAANREALLEFGADVLVASPEECYNVLLQML
jgi:phosphoglycolate phosphatase